MKPSYYNGLVVLVLATLLGCGVGARDVREGEPPPPPALAVFALDGKDLPATPPVLLDLEQPVQFTLTGQGFGEPDGVATVVFRATEGKPFLGGTLDAIDVPGDVMSETKIHGVLALPGVADPVPVTVEVRLGDGSVSEPVGGVEFWDSSLVAPMALGPARLLDIDADGIPCKADKIVVLFDRRITLADMVDVPCVPTGSLGITPAAPYVGGAESHELHIPLGADPHLRTRHAYDVSIGDNAPTGLEVRMDSGVLNVVDEPPESDVTLDIIPGLAVGRELTDSEGEAVSTDTRGLVCGDFDQDGIHDVMAVDHRGALLLYRGLKSPAGLAPAEPQAVFILDDMEEPVDVHIGTGFFTAAAAGDLDNDGHLDLVVARTGGRDWVLLWNEDNQGFERVQTLGLTDTTAVALGDLDRDGRLDIVTASKGGGSRLWRNKDGRTFEDSGLRLDEEFVSEAVILDDVDVDGDLDIVLGNFGESNSIWLNSQKDASDASGFPRTFGSYVAAAGTFVADLQMDPAKTFGLASGDLDGDGDLDYVEVIFEGPVRVWTQDVDEDPGTPWFTGRPMFDEDPGVPAGDRRSVALGDVDGDGDLDVTVGTASSGASVWLNDGAGKFTDSLQRLGSGRIRALALADFDADGDLDLVTGHAGAPDRLWFNSLSGTWGEARFDGTPPADANEWIAAVAIGAGRDGEDYRVAAVDLSGRNELWMSEGGTLKKIGSLNETLAGRSVAIGDLDGDDLTDVVIGYSAGLEISWGDDSGSSALGSPVTYHALSVADVDDDGALELIALRPEGLEIFWFAGKANTATSLLGAPDGTPYLASVVADLNGDGRTDVAAAYAGGIHIWPGPDRALADRHPITIDDGTGLVVAFNIDGDMYPEPRTAATANTKVDVDHAQRKFELTDGTKWGATPAPGRTITVSGSNNNSGTFTVEESSPYEILVVEPLSDEGSDDPAITIQWTEPPTQMLDLVVATTEKVVYLLNEGVVGELDFASPVDVDAEKIVATGLAANADMVVASDEYGYTGWARDESNGTLKRSFFDRDGPAADAVAIGPRGEVVLARPGLGHEVLTVGLFAYSKATAALHDLDGDGDLDLATTESDGVNRIYRNDDGSFALWQSVGHGFAEVGDIDRDGDLDLVTGKANGRGAQIWKQDAGAFTPGDTLLETDVTRGARIADFFREGLPGRDGQPDVLVVGESGVQLFERGADGAFSGPGHEIAPVAGVLDVAVGDIDGDCLLDLVLATPNGILRYIVQPDGAFGALQGDRLAAAGDTRALALADVVDHDGTAGPDGKLDLITGGRDGALLVWSDVGGADPESESRDDGPLWIEALALSWIDGDGVLDLVVGSFGGANLLLLNSKEPASQPFGGLWTESLAIGDVDRDGDNDVLIRSREEKVTEAPSVHHNK